MYTASLIYLTFVGQIQKFDQWIIGHYMYAEAVSEVLSFELHTKYVLMRGVYARVFMQVVGTMLRS